MYMKQFYYFAWVERCTNMAQVYAVIATSFVIRGAVYECLLMHWFWFRAL